MDKNNVVACGGIEKQLHHFTQASELIFCIQCGEIRKLAATDPDKPPPNPPHPPNG